MVILISAPSCTGKTMIAHQLMEKHNITYYSIDHIKMGLIRGWNQCGFKADDSEETITKKIWPVIRGIIMTAIENNQSLIIEGVYIPPEDIAKFDDEYGRHIIPVFMCFSEEYIRTNFEDRILKYRNVIEERMYAEDRNMSYFIDSHKELAERCKKNNVKCFKAENSYDKMISNIHEYIDGQIKD